MPEIKPVEPDPDNAGVGNNKNKWRQTKFAKPLLQSSWVKLKSGLCEIL
jgi:hypothetical protein